MAPAAALDSIGDLDLADPHFTSSTLSASRD
jgi:hypothetical protein